MLNYLPLVGDTIRVTGTLMFGESQPGVPDPSGPAIGATGTVEQVWGPVSNGYQIVVLWDPPYESLRLMLVQEDPFVVQGISPDSPEWSPHDEGTRYGLDDQVTRCPHCQSRTEEEDNEDGSQNHTCMNCGFRFVGDWEDWSEDDDDDEEYDE